MTNPFNDHKLHRLWFLYCLIYEISHYDDTIITIIKENNLFESIQQKINEFCDLFIILFDKSPDYLHLLKFHLIEIWIKYGSLLNFMNYVNESLGFHHKCDLLLKCRNNGLNSNVREEIIVQHCFYLLLHHPYLKNSLLEYVKKRYNSLNVKDFDNYEKLKTPIYI
ncbi:hypothetical protein ABK040_008346 [Willaertia magna]